MNVEPTHLNVDEWRSQFSPAPHRNTVLKWIRLGLIQPAAKKVGRRWYLPKGAQFSKPPSAN